MTHNEPVGQSSSDNERTVSLRAYAKLEKELESVKQEFRGYIEQLQTKVEKNEDKGRWLTDDIVNLENEVEEVRSSTQNPQGSEGENGSPESTPLEDIADDEKENPPGVQVGPSVTRAAAIMSNWDKWSKTAPKGRTIRDGLKQLIETATGESLAWKQVYRACRKVEQLTKGKIVLTRTKRHGNVLLQPSSAATS